MGTYLLKVEVEMGVACIKLRLSLIKGIYFGHIQWDSMSKAQTEWANLYESGVLEMRDTIVAKAL